MTPKRRRWHRHRYLLTEESVAATSMIEQPVDFQTAENTDTDNRVTFSTDRQSEPRWQRNEQASLKAKVADSAP